MFAPCRCRSLGLNIHVSSVESGEAFSGVGACDRGNEFCRRHRSGRQLTYNIHKHFRADLKDQLTFRSKSTGIMANTLADHNKIVEVSKNFRDYLIPLDHPRLHPNDRDARTHGKGVLGNDGIFLTPVARGWLQNYQSPYHGFTTDGTVRQNLWKADPKANGPTKEMVAAAENLFKVASTDEQKRFSYDVNAKEWRSWSNPEVSFRIHGRV